MTKILVSAGDTSGDRYAASVLAEIKASNPGVRFAGVGGDLLNAEGAELYQNNAGVGVMGFVEVMSKIPGHLRLLGRLKREIDSGVFDLVILVDYPDFNLRIARIAARTGVPVLYYVAPQVWAWRSGRARQIRRDVSRMAVILPFEKEYFARRGIEADWVGHPLLDFDKTVGREEARASFGIDAARTVVALLPGSRPQEIRRHWPVFGDAARRISAEFAEVTFLVGARVENTARIDCKVFPGRIDEILAASDGAICKSGTIGLQAALANVPGVIAYRTDPLSFAIARRLVRLGNIGLVNLLVGETAVPEYVQRQATGKNLSSGLLNVLRNIDGIRDRQLAAFARVRELLGQPGASRRVADMVLEMVV